MHLDIDIDADVAPDWPEEIGELAARAAAAAAQVVPGLANPRLAASLLFTCDAELQALNRKWRGKDRATNVLSFLMLAPGELAAIGREGPPVLLGDVALAAETCRREAAEKGITLEQHAAHLVVHGLLHLAGHDHETSPADAAAMEALEIKALALLGIADPYGGDA